MFTSTLIVGAALAAAVESWILGCAAWRATVLNDARSMVTTNVEQSFADQSNRWCSWRRVRTTSRADCIDDANSSCRTRTIECPNIVSVGFVGTAPWQPSERRMALGLDARIRRVPKRDCRTRCGHLAVRTSIHRLRTSKVSQNQSQPRRKAKNGEKSLQKWRFKRPCAVPTRRRRPCAPSRGARPRCEVPCAPCTRRQRRP